MPERQHVNGHRHLKCTPDLLHPPAGMQLQAARCLGEAAREDRMCGDSSPPPPRDLLERGGGRGSRGGGQGVQGGAPPPAGMKIQASPCPPPL